MRNISTILLLLFIETSLFSEEVTNHSLYNTLRLKTYPGFNLWIDNSIPNFYEIAPYIMFQPVQHLSIGVSGVFIYHYNSAPKFRKGASIFGSRYFTNIYLIKNFDNILKVKSKAGIFIHAEYEYLRLPTGFFDNSGQFNGHYNSNSLLIGPAFNQPFGKHANFQVLVLINCSMQKAYPYSNPMVRFGFNF